MKLNSLRSRMTAAFALAFATLILVFGGFVLWFARYTARSAAEAALQTAVSRVRDEAAEAQRDPDNSGWSEAANDLSRQNLALAITNAQGRVTFQTPGPIPTGPHPDADEWRIRAVALKSGAAIIGFHWRKTENALRLQALTLAALSLTLFLAATLGVWVLIGRTLSPIYSLSVQADAASTESLQVHLNAPSQDAEITHLVGTLNGMLGRLSGAVSARERFYAAASHELRTPLQTLTGSLELALMRERKAEEYRAALEPI